MRNNFALFLIFLFAVLIGKAQVGIGTTQPHGSSQLDIVSSTKGVVFPRMTASQRSAIENPTEGLMVYQNDGTKGIYFFDGTNWRSLTSGYVPNEQGYSTNSTAIGSVTTIAGNGVLGNSNGPGSTATFANPWGIAADKTGSIYVSDHGNGNIRKITLGDHGLSQVSLYINISPSPVGINFDHKGNLFVTTTNNTIQKISPNGSASLFAGRAGIFGNSDGIGTNATFHHPYSLVFDEDNLMYVSDLGNSVIRTITPEGLVTTLDIRNPDGSKKYFSFSTGLAIDKFKNIYVCEPNTIYKISANQLIPFAGQGTSIATDLFNPGSLVFDSDNNLYVADRGSRIRKIAPDGNTTLLAGGFSAGNANGVGEDAQFSYIGYLMVLGNYLYVTDSQNRCVKRIVIK